MTTYALKIIIEGEDRASGAIKGVGSALGDIGKIAAGVSLGNLFSGAVQSLTGMTGAALQSYASYERLSQSIGAMAAKEALLTGAASNMAQALAMTKEQSKETLDWISKLAIQSPFKQSDVAQAFRLAQALGFNTQEAKRLTQATLDWATATGAQGYDIERVNRALGQMQVKGKVSQEEINQLTEAGVDAQRILSGAFGKSGTDLQKAFQDGSITSRQAIEAILKDMEKLYQGAGANSANSMTGLLSTLEEIQDIAGRNLFGGMFQAAQPYIAELTGVLSAPEFQAGLTDLGLKLGGGLTAGLDGIVQKAGEINDAIKPLLDAKAPDWLVVLQGAFALSGKPLDIVISPTITKINTPDGGLSVEVTATAAKVTVGDTKVTLTSDWKEGTIGSLIASAQDAANSKKILLKAGWDPTFTTIWTGLANIKAQLEQAKIMLTPVINPFGWLVQLAKLSLDSFGKVNITALVTADWGKTWEEVHEAFADVVGNWGTFWQETHNVIANIIPDLSAFPQWLQDAMGGLGLGGPQTPANANGGINIGGTMRQRAAPTQAVRDKSQDQPGMLTPVSPYPGQRYWGRATGDAYWRGGWAMVGEEGPELVNMPRGARIFNHSDTKRMIPGFAEGNTSAGAFGNGLEGFFRLIGIWKTQTVGPPTREQWNKTFHDIAGAGEQAAQRTGDAFAAAADSTAKAFAGTLESALGNVPGLFGTSQVTEQDMQLAKVGAYKPKADEYLRQLSDEVINGKEHGPNVDIKDAAKRAGIDPNLPNEIVLELVKEAWANGSFFSNKANLDLINTDAVKSSLEQQQKEAQGKANIMSMFGLTDENSQATADQLGAALNTVFGKAAESDAMAGSGTTIFNKLIGGLSDPSTAAAGVGAMAASLTAATGTAENSQAIYDGGVATGIQWLKGFDYAMQNASITPPSAAGPPPAPTGTGATAPAKNALGTPHWRGGWTVAGEYGPELLDLPGGTRIYDAPTTARMRGDAQPVTVNQTFVVNSELLVEMAAQRTVQLIRRRGH